MKKVLLLVCLMVSLVCIGQTKKKVYPPKSGRPSMPTQQQPSKHKDVAESLLKRVDSLFQVNNDMLEHIEMDMSLKNRYKLYKTENLYNMLKLDTETGKIEQVQWSFDDTNEGSIIINDEDLTWGFGKGSGTFELYPTNNMYQFILLDKTDGRMWHVQWGQNSSNRWIRMIF